MAARHSPTLTHGAESLFEGFENLMPFRVHDILLVSSLYDSFILREDGRLNELLIERIARSALRTYPESRMSPVERKRDWPDRSRGSI